MSLFKLAAQHDHKCEKISPNIPLWTDMAEKFKGRLTILATTCSKDKREKIAKKHTLSVSAHANDQTLLTIYTDGSKTKEGTCQGTPAAYPPVTGQGCLNGCGSAKAG
jgi:hypothetical protein